MQRSERTIGRLPERCHPRSPRAASAARVAAALGAAGLLHALAAPAALANNGVALISSSTRSYGRGGTEVAIGDDALTSPSNPATLSESTAHIRIDASLTLAVERVRTTSRFEDTVDTNVIGAPFPAVGVVWDAFRDDPTAENPDPGPSNARIAFVLWQPIGLVISPSIGFSFQVNEWLSLGAMVCPLATDLNITITGTAGGGSVDPNAPPDFLPNGKVFVHRQPDGTPVSPPQAFDAGTGTQVTWADIFRLANGVGFDPTAAPPKPNLTLDVKDTYGFGIMGQIGGLVKPHPDFAIGLNLRSPGIVFAPQGKAFVNLSGAVDSIKANPQVGDLLDAAFETYLPKGGKDGYEAEYDLKGSNIILPWAVMLGVSWHPVPSVLLAADTRFISWTDASGEIKLEGQKGSNDDFNEINGGSKIDYTVKFKWRDQLVLAGGVAWAPVDWLALRCGFNWGRNPVPKEFLLGNSLGTESHATLGIGFLVGDWNIDFSYMYGLPYQVKYDEVSQRSTSEQHFFIVGAGVKF